MDKSKSTACLSNINTYESKLQQWLINNPNETPTLKDLNIPEKCPEGGIYSISDDNTTIYCSLHNPNPNASNPENK